MLHQEKELFHQEKFYIGCRLFLASIPTIGRRSIIKLYECFHNSAEEIWEAPLERIRNSGVLSNKQMEEFQKYRKEYCFSAAEILMKKAISIVTYGEKGFPKRLLDIADPPFLLFYRGELPEDSCPAVAVIGARMCSEYGKKMAIELSMQLARNGVNIISGLASGIDGLSQKAALDAGGKSFGVLGSGADVCYPSTNYPIYKRLMENGGVISEYMPGTKPEAYHFPERNRIISGLADIVLVIEAKEKSGTAITVSMALEQGKEVMAVPGRNIDPLSIGCNRMIRDGAGMVMGVEDLLESLSLQGYSFCKESAEDTKIKQQTVEDVCSNFRITHENQEVQKCARRIYDFCVNEPATTDAILNNEMKYGKTAEDTKPLLSWMELNDYLFFRGGFWSIM